MFDRRVIDKIDWTVLAVVVAVAAVGVLNIYSATHLGSGRIATLYLKQLAWLTLGALLLVVLAATDYHRLEQFAYLIYVASVVLLLTLAAVGKISSGAQRWFQVGPLTLQPSELAKLAIIIVLARYFHEDKAQRAYALKDLLLPGLLVAVPMGLIVEQPDLGTALILGVIFLSVILVLGVRLWTLLLGVGAVGAIIPWAWHYLKDYQRRRVLTFLNPEFDPLGAGYHIIQSKIAVGSGQLFGKGFLNGTQGQLNFLPAQQTDFIFAVFAEEWGFIGALVLLGLYLFLFFWGLSTAAQAKDKFGAILAFGVVSMLFWHVIINIGMAIGVLPVVGVPLPLMSYGGSSVVSVMMGLGILMSVRVRRFIF
ncbi:MAG: rod shape-determining protein RodA [Deltaproteobacteria bacterium]|nr:rod shape-determining protein RodA [Deltaproteobacteria bacterium]MBI3077894.1 rod shape-determining protein RodA [Deltaproteobacteria bacterium]